MQPSSSYRIKFLALVFSLGLAYALVPRQEIARHLEALEPAAGGDNTAAGMIAVHKAVYDFKMVSVEAGAGINGVTGRMYLEQDDICDAWTTDHRFVTEYQYAERAGMSNTSHYVAFESKDQRQFSFSSERQENGEATEQLRGSVTIAANGSAMAVYSRPDNLKYDLPEGYLLPTAHTIEIIRQARAGEKFFRRVIFDGTDADGPVEISAFIGKKVTADEIGKVAEGGNQKIDVMLLTPDAWHVRMAIFPLQASESMMPSYEMEVILHDNGVISYALIDYKTFRLEQNLSALEKLPARKCS